MFRFHSVTKKRSSGGKYPWRVVYERSACVDYRVWKSLRSRQIDMLSPVSKAWSTDPFYLPVVTVVPELLSGLFVHRSIRGNDSQSSHHQGSLPIPRLLRCLQLHSSVCCSNIQSFVKPRLTVQAMFVLQSIGWQHENLAQRLKCRFIDASLPIFGHRSWHN